jgi:hypothetical protein
MILEHKDGKLGVKDRSVRDMKVTALPLRAPKHYLITAECGGPKSALIDDLTVGTE